MLALQAIEADLGPHGIPMSEALDPANEMKFETPDFPLLDYAARAMSKKQKAYYAAYDTDKKNPMDRSGHIWPVRKKT